MQSEPLPPFGAIAAPTPAAGRSPKIKRAIFISLPFIVLLLVAGIALLLLQLVTWMGVRSYQADDADAARARFTWQQNLPFPSPWVSAYNLGTTELSQGNTIRALPLLEQAFADVPKAIPDESGAIQAFTYECSVRLNISAAYEIQGDSARDLGDIAKADLEYAKAQEWLQPCSVGGSSAGGEGGESEEQTPSQGQPQDDSGNGDPNEGSPNEGAPSQGSPGDGGAGDRLDQKRRELQGDQPENSQREEPNPGEGEGQGESDQPREPFEGETEAERERREELQQQKNDQAERQREREESSNRNSTPRGW